MLDRGIFKAYDIRGIYPTELDEEGGNAIGRAYVEQFEPKEIAVGRDMRVSSPSMANAVIEGATAAGASVVDIGLVGTEMLYFAVGDLELDRLSHQVTRRGEEIVLQPREFRLLEYLMKHAGQVVTRTMLLEHVWDYHFDPQTNVIDVHVSRLRAKIDRGFEPQLLHTVRGAGYRLAVEGGTDVV